jgi:hypothetical protein
MKGVQFMIEPVVSLEELLDQYLEVKRVREEIETSFKSVGAQILFLLDREQVQEKIVRDRRILKVVRTTFNTTVEQARELKATETVEQVNKEALKFLHKQGIEVPGTVISAYIKVS